MLTITVSPVGNDEWSGRREDPSSDGRDGPLATPARARDAVREARRAGWTGAVTVLLRNGSYRPDEPLVLGPEDGGTAEAPVSWSAFAGERPCIEAGRPLRGWTRFHGVLPGLPERALGRLWVAEVNPGWHFSRLFRDGEDLARSASVLSDDWRTWPVCQLGVHPDEEVVLPPDAIPPEGDGEDADLDFLPTPYTRWANAIAAVREIDRSRCVLRFATLRTPRPDRIKDIPFRLENLASGLVEPGRWYLDSRTGRLYLWPPGDESPEGHEMVAPFLTEVLRVEGGVRHLTLAGIAVRHARCPRSFSGASYDAPGAALLLNGLEDCRIQGLRFSDLEGWAIRGGPELRRVAIRGCEVSRGGGGGILIAGQTTGGPFPCEDNRIEDNVVRGSARRYWHCAGIGVGIAGRTRVAHNLVEDMPYIGISCWGGPRHTYFRGWPRPAPELEALWREHGEEEPSIDAVKRYIPGHNRIEKNVVHHVMQLLDDGAAIYCHAGHHEEVRDNVVYAVMGRGSMGLYFDDEQMDSIMEGNLVYRCPERDEPENHSAAIHFHHNGRNRLVNNVVVGGRQLLSIPSGYGGHLLERNVLVWSGEPNWDRADPRAVTGAGDGRRQAGWVAGPSVARLNLWWHVDGPAAAERLLETWRSRGYGQGSIAADPLFRDAARADYRIGPGSPALGLGIRPLEVEDAGPRPDDNDLWDESTG